MRFVAIAAYGRAGMNSSLDWTARLLHGWPKGFFIATLIRGGVATAGSGFLNRGGRHIGRWRSEYD
jgi:hypothetical protein